MGDASEEHLLGTQETPQFESLHEGAFDSWDALSRPSVDRKTKVALQDPFAVAVDPFFKSKGVSRGSFALDLEGFEQQALKKAALATPANSRGGALRRSSSFNNIDTLRFSTGDDDPFASFDSMPFELPTFQRAKTADFAESVHKSKSSPDTKTSSDRRKTLEDTEPTTKRKGIRSTHRSPTRGVGRSKSQEEDLLPPSRKASSNNDRSRPRSPKRNHTADSCLLQKTSTGGRSRDNTKHSHSKSVSIEEGSSRPRNKDKSKSPTRPSSRRGEKESSKSQHSARHRLNKSSGSIGSESSANSRLNKSAGSLDSKSNKNRQQLSASSSELDYIQENGPTGLLAQAMAKMKARDDMDIHDTPHITPSSNKSKSSKSKHGSSSSKSKLMQDGSENSRERNRGDTRSRSASRSASKSGSDRSRSNSRSRLNKAASKATGSSLLKGAIDDSNHDDHLLPGGDAKKQKFPTKHRSTDSRGGTSGISSKSSRSGREGTQSNHPISSKTSRSGQDGRSRSENKYPARERDQTEEPAGTKGRHHGSRSENKYPTRDRGRGGSVEAKDRHRSRSGNKHPNRNRGRSGSGEPGKRSRRTGSVETPRNRRSGSVEAPRGRRTHSVDAKSHRRTGSVEARSRRTEAPTRDEPGLRRAKTGDASPRGRSTRDGQSGPEFGRSNTASLAEESKEREVFLPSISGLTGGEGPTWKVQTAKAKAQPCDGDAVDRTTKNANKARRLTQAEYGIKINQAKQR